MYSLDMPLFDGERPARFIEMNDAHIRHNALPGFSDQTGFNAALAYFGFVLRATPAGPYDYLLARPRLDDGRADPDTWWVWDADVDESEGWIAQATFNERGLIEHPTDPRFAMHDDRMDEREADEEFPAWPAWSDEAGATPTASPSEPRDPNAPVRMNIDLEEHETAVREGIPAWEEHEHFAVLATDKGFAVIFSAPVLALVVGLVRYPDKTSCTIKEPTPQSARLMAEKFLAERPYKNAYQRVLGEAEFDAAEPEGGARVPETPAPSLPRPMQEKRVWSTTPLSSGDDEDD